MTYNNYKKFPWQTGLIQNTCLDRIDALFSQSLQNMLPVLLTLITVLFSLTILELLLSACWSETYWRIGLPLLRYELPIRIGKPALDLESLPRKLLDDGYAAFVFHQFDNGYIAFRESMRPLIGSFYYTPIMRGSLRITADNQVEVTGRLNWFFVVSPPLFVLPFFALRGQIPGFLLALAPLLVAGILIFTFRIQRQRFRRLADIIAS